MKRSYFTKKLFEITFPRSICRGHHLISFSLATTLSTWLMIPSCYVGLTNLCFFSERSSHRKMLGLVWQNGRFRPWFYFALLKTIYPNSTKFLLDDFLHIIFALDNPIQIYFRVDKT